MGRVDVWITESVIDVAALEKRHPNPEHGAQLAFVGVVRKHNHGRQVKAVAYDVFEPLAEATLRQIASEAQMRWEPGADLVVIHRQGTLAVGETSVAIVVSTPHRHEAYEISRYIIDELKVRAPIWKKEFYVDGETEWLAGHVLCGRHDDADHRSGVGGRAVAADGPR